MQLTDSMALVALGIGVLCCAATWSGARHKPLSRYLLLAGLVLAAGLQVTDHGTLGMLRFIGGGIAGFVLLAPFRGASVMSWDDVRVMGVSGALLGPTGAFVGSLLALAIGAIVTLGLFMARRAMATGGNGPDPSATLVLDEHAMAPTVTGFPFALAIAAGSWAALALTPIVSGVLH